MAQSNMNPNILAEQLDEILPANSGMILDGEYNNPRLDVAKMLAAYSNEQLNDQSHHLIEERMMLALDQAESKIWRRSSPRILLSVAVIALFAGCAAWFAVIGLPQPVSETLNGFFVQEQSETVTATEELLITEIATEITPSAVPTEVIPTETATEIVPTLVATATEITIIPTPTRIPETAFVQVNAVNVRAEADPNSPILTTATLNQAVLIINVTADEAWSHVQLTDGTVGWINSDFLGATQVIVQPANNGGNDNPPPPNGGNGNGNGGNGNDNGGNGGNGNGNGGRGGRGGRGGN